MAKQPKRIMSEFKIAEISAVDVPAQEGAKMVLMKRADLEKPNSDKGETQMTPPTEKNSDISLEIAKRYIDTTEGAVSFGTALAEEIKSSIYWETMNAVGPYLYSLDTSLRSIAGDVQVDNETKLTMMRNTVEDFMLVIRQVWSGIDQVVEQSLAGKSIEGDATMTARTVKSYEDENLDLTKQIEDLKKSNDTAKFAEQLEALGKQVESLTAERDEATAKASMTDAEKEFMGTLDKEEKAKFMSMSGDERKARMKKSAEDDDTVVIKGRTIRKSAVGEDVFEIFKAQAAEAEVLRKSVEEERDRRETAEFGKRAEDELGHLPGTVTERANILKAVSKLPEDVRTSIEKALTAGDKAVKSAFSTLGTNSGLSDDVSKSSQAFTSKVADIMNRDKCTKTTAIAKARSLDADGFAAFREAGGKL